MKNSFHIIRTAFAVFGAGAPGLIMLLLLVGTTRRVMAQSSDFNAGNDSGWTHYSLPDIPPNVPPYYLPVGYYGAATYSFPPDGSAGKAYRIFAPAITNDIIGAQNARAGAFHTSPVYSGRFSVGVDLLAWNADWRQEAGILFFLSNVGLGTSDGYSATYSSAYKQLYISVITGESERTVGELGSDTVVLDKTHAYRLAVSSHDGATYLFQIFDKSEPNTPWTSAIGQDSTYLAGLCGLFVFEQDKPPSTSGADATFDNYAATAPAAGSLPATVTDVAPAPASKSTTFYPTVTVGILDRDTAVDTNSILLSLDGAWIPNSALTSVESQVHRPNNPAAYPRDFAGATVAYAIPNQLPWGSKHTNSVAYRDSLNTWRTNSWTWTSAYPYLFASNSLPLGSLNVRGFDVRMAQSDNSCANLANSLDRARQQLAIPPQIPVDRSATSLVQVLSWDKTADPSSGNNVPGLCASTANPTCGNYNNIAVEAVAYLELTAGLHRFRVNSDDRAGVYSGVGLSDPNAQILWENPGSTANATFDFVVEADGLYPIRCLWEETGGGAHLYLSSVDVTTLTEIPINDPSNPSGVVKAWYPLACLSSSSATGPYAADATAKNVLNTTPLVGADCAPTVVGQMATGGTFTVPVPASTKFYRLNGPRGTKITNITKNSGNLVITYQIL